MTGLLSIRSRTGQQLAEALQIPLWRSTVPPEATFAIRWGSTSSSSIPTLNRAEAIAKASDKALTRQLLAQAGIPVPLASETAFPVIGRTRKHRQGRGFWYCENEQDVQNAKIRGAFYFSQYYPKQNEYRVHIAGGKVLLFSIKEGDKTKLIWNKRKSGFLFRHMRRSEWLEDENLMNIQRKAKQAISLLGLDFGAVDIMADAPSPFPRFVISEVNTAPSLSPLAISKYVAYFKEKIIAY